jgi:hypothetical protein
LVLVDAAGRQIINTYVPYGEAPAFTGDPATVKRIVASKGPVVSGLFVSLVAKSPVYNISMPVLRDGAVRYVMSLGLLPGDLARILENLKLNESWVTTIWDRDNVVVARSRDHDRFLGTKVPNTLRQEQVMSQALLKTTTPRTNREHSAEGVNPQYLGVALGTRPHPGQLPRYANRISTQSTA